MERYGRSLPHSITPCGKINARCAYMTERHKHHHVTCISPQIDMSVDSGCTSQPQVQPRFSSYCSFGVMQSIEAAVCHTACVLQLGSRAPTVAHGTCCRHLPEWGHGRDMSMADLLAYFTPVKCLLLDHHQCRQLVPAWQRAIGKLKVACMWGGLGARFGGNTSSCFDVPWRGPLAVSAAF
jgi:hypothetical protein